LKATAAASAQVSKFCFHRAIPGIKLSHLISCAYAAALSFPSACYVYILHLQQGIYSEANSLIFNFCCHFFCCRIKRCWEVSLTTFIAALAPYRAFLKVSVVKARRYESLSKEDVPT